MTRFVMLFFFWLLVFSFNLLNGRQRLFRTMAQIESLYIGPNGDEDGVSLADCGVRMAKAGADLIGLNCLFDPFITLENMKTIKEALDQQNLKPFLMCQPLGYKTPDAGDFGWIDIPEFPYAVEPRQITRIEAAKYARQAYDLGIRYTIIRPVQILL